MSCSARYDSNIQNKEHSAAPNSRGDVAPELISRFSSSTGDLSPDLVARAVM